MATITETLKVDLANNFVQSFASSNYYFVGAKATPIDDVPIPDPDTDIEGGYYTVFHEMLWGKKIETTDVKFMIRNVQWTSGTEYAIYDSANNSLSSQNFFVVASQPGNSYGVFKCLDKPHFGDKLVFDKPLVAETSAEDTVYKTADGYQWKYMFSIDSVTYDKFATDDFVPVVVDANVTANAISGSIDSIQISDTGSLYNSYSSGRIVTPEYLGDELKYVITTEDYFAVNTFDLINANGTFETGNVDIIVDGNTIPGIIYITDDNSISVVIDDSTKTVTQSVVLSSNVVVQTANAYGEVVNARRENLPTLSSNTNFYKDSSIYIRSGAGSGEIRKITSYEKSGNQFILMIDTAFTTTPTSKSYFYIRPTVEIVGDGTGAKALPVLDTTANTIVDILMINSGSGYSYATATVIGNTGLIAANGDVVGTNPASIRPIISPLGGHGSDVYNELYAHNVGISASFINDEVNVNIPFSQFAIIRDPQFDNVTLEFSSYGSEYSNGEIITQDVTNATGTIKEIDALNNTITLTNVSGIFSANDDVTGATSNNTLTPISVNKDLTLFNNVREIELTYTTGTFANGDVGYNNADTNHSFIVREVSNNIISVTDLKGDFVAGDTVQNSDESVIAEIVSISDKDIINNTGQIVYVENSEEITRSNSTTETLKVIFDI